MLTRVSDVRLPSDFDREYTTVDPEGIVLKELIPGASMFCLSVKLLNILHDILEAVYVNLQAHSADRSGPRDAKLLEQSLKLNHELDQFLASMPERLGNFIASSPSTNSDQIYDFNLHEQALVTRLALHPLFKAFPSRHQQRHNR